VAQIVLTSIIVFGCLAGLIALLLAWPSGHLREVVYRFVERFNQFPKQLP
jgi:hypothetical protein